VIEVNLIPDVKLELLRAQRQRLGVISLSMSVAIITGALVALLASYVFIVQSVAMSLADNSIKDETAKLQRVPDLAKTLTIQKQLDTVSSLHNSKLLSSRLFDIMTTIVPTGSSSIAISHIELDSGNINIEGQAASGYPALEAFKKTISKTTFSYVQAGDTKASEPIHIASDIVNGDQRYGESSDGTRVLNFMISFTYPNELFAPTSERGRIVAPNKQNATDSAVGVPTSLFTTVSAGGSN